MRRFFPELKKRNKLLYYYGWWMLMGAIICGLLTQIQPDKIVMGIIAWIKPSKFFLSITIFSWTMGWFLIYMDKPRKATIYSWMVVLVMSFEIFVITWQASNGRLSHFNITSSLYLLLYNLMGVAIVILTLWTGYIAYLFFRKKNYKVPMTYIWGIRLGLIFFVIFSFEGGVMATRLSHTVGFQDGSPGLPYVNWSTAFGDLRVAHFFGIHSLQLLPLTGYYLARNNKQLFLFAALYFTWLVVLLAQAINKIPLLG